MFNFLTPPPEAEFPSFPMDRRFLEDRDDSGMLKFTEDKKRSVLRKQTIQYASHIELISSIDGLCSIKHDGCYRVEQKFRESLLHLLLRTFHLHHGYHE